MKAKQKKQIRLYDIYRYIVTGECSTIKGIDTYTCTKDAGTIAVNYTDTTNQFITYKRIYFTHNEQELKNVITQINAELGNCRKPGRRKRYVC